MYFQILCKIFICRGISTKEKWSKDTCEHPRLTVPRTRRTSEWNKVQDGGLSIYPHLSAGLWRPGPIGVYHYYYQNTIITIDWVPSSTLLDKSTLLWTMDHPRIIYVVKKSYHYSCHSSCIKSLTSGWPVYHTPETPDVDSELLHTRDGTPESKTTLTRTIWTVRHL